MSLLERAPWLSRRGWHVLKLESPSSLYVDWYTIFLVLTKFPAAADALADIGSRAALMPTPVATIVAHHGTPQAS